MPELLSSLFFGVCLLLLLLLSFRLVQLLELQFVEQLTLDRHEHIVPIHVQQLRIVVFAIPSSEALANQFHIVLSNSRMYVSQQATNATAVTSPITSSCHSARTGRGAVQKWYTSMHACRKNRQHGRKTGQGNVYTPRPKSRQVSPAVFGT